MQNHQVIHFHICFIKEEKEGDEKREREIERKKERKKKRERQRERGRERGKKMLLFVTFC
jgi:hypothetical protein